MIALDAKLNFDDNALFRHPDIVEMRDLDEEDPAEIEASKFDLSYISLDGNIGCLVNGAGLAMATMDVIKLYGGEPANFLDVGGGATAEKVTEAFKIMLKNPGLKAILVNIFGGIMKCDTIANGVIAAAREVQLKVPLVVRMKGTNEELGRKILAESGLPIISADNMGERGGEGRGSREGKIDRFVAPAQAGAQSSFPRREREPSVVGLMRIRSVFCVYILAEHKLMAHCTLGVTYNLLQQRHGEHNEGIACRALLIQHGVTRLVWFERHESMRSAQLPERSRLRSGDRDWKVESDSRQTNPDWNDLYNEISRDEALGSRIRGNDDTERLRRGDGITK